VVAGNRCGWAQSLVFTTDELCNDCGRGINSGEEKMEDKHDLELVISTADTHTAYKLFI
jgi:hypothetical protein